MTHSGISGWMNECRGKFMEESINPGLHAWSDAQLKKHFIQTDSIMVKCAWMHSRNSAFPKVQILSNGEALVPRMNEIPE